MMTNAPPVTTLFPDRLTVCTYGGFAPVCYKNADGQLVGFDVSFLTRFAESLGLPIVTIEKSFNGIWTWPGKDECDVAGAGVMRQDEKKRPIGPHASWSDPYFQVNRSLLIRTQDAAAFADYKRLKGKTIVVTEGSTADTDAQERYPNCTIKYVDQVAAGHPDAQEYIVRTLLANHKVDAFGEGDVSNQYLAAQYGKDVLGGLALADVHPIDGPTETFNFIVRNASSGILDRLNDFITKNKGSYAPKA
jgi:ABC-type amino acid transport substrate-binding protein